MPSRAVVTEGCSEQGPSVQPLDRALCPLHGSDALVRGPSVTRDGLSLPTGGGVAIAHALPRSLLHLQITAKSSPDVCTVAPGNPHNITSPLGWHSCFTIVSHLQIKTGGSHLQIKTGGSPLPVPSRLLLHLQSHGKAILSQHLTSKCSYACGLMSSSISLCIVGRLLVSQL